MAEDKTDLTVPNPATVIPKAAKVYAWTSFKHNPLQLKSGAIGRIEGQRDDPVTPSDNVVFERSVDGGKTWSTSRVDVEGEITGQRAHPYCTGSAIVTNSGRIIVPVYRRVGRRDFVPDQRTNVALQGDKWALSGSHSYEPCPYVCFVYCSDDEGKTWQRNANGEMMITLDDSAGGHWSCSEPTVAEYSPKHLLMLYRTSLGRVFQSWSCDDGTNWTRPRPSQLSTAQAPPFLKRIPGTNDLLMIWNQATGDEIERGLQRGRLSSAISQDGGATWKFHKNVVCLDKDDRSYVEPSPVRYYRAARFSPRFPANFVMSHNQSFSFWEDRVYIRYVEDPYRIWNPENQVGDRKANSITISLPVSWFYTPRASDDFNRDRALDSFTEHLAPPDGKW